MTSVKYLGILLIFALGCVPPSEDVITDVNVDMADSEVKRIWNFADKQSFDSLKNYFGHKNPTYRFMAAQSFNATKNIKYIDSLVGLLSDENYDVKGAAAYAIGQVGNGETTENLINAFIGKDTFDIDNIANANILEAVGKTGDVEDLQALATVSTYRNTDTLLLLGQSRAIYQFALRGLIEPQATDLMVNYVTSDDIPKKVKLMAAHYLARAKNIDLSGYKFRLIDLLNKSSEPNIKMAISIALGKVKDSEVLNALKNKLEQETDYRVNCNILRALRNFEYALISDALFRKIKDKNLHIAQIAAGLLIEKGDRRAALTYKDLISEDNHWSVNAKIYTAILKHTPIYYTNTKFKIVQEIKNRIEATNNRYEKAAYIRALGHDPFNYETIIKDYAGSNSQIINTSCIEALNNCLASENFIKAFGYGHRRIKRKILVFLKERLRKHDVGECATIAQILKTPEFEYKMLVDSTNFLDSVMVALKLPKDIEAYNALGEAKAYLTDSSFERRTPEFNHHIKWEILNNFSDSSRVVIKTTKGNITLELFPEKSPGSVINFLGLATDKFYNRKTFHRVVPNFVIQGGCPRGDGYGALDYSIRSELSQQYYDDEGYIGMASAGNHTEGTQFFITHSPTPHLDGKYTIFGKVVEGMNVVHDIQVGDRIESIIIMYH